VSEASEKKEWKERGVGDLKLLVSRGDLDDPETPLKGRFVMRADKSHRLLLNTPILKHGKYGTSEGKSPSNGLMLFTGTIDDKPVELLQLKVWWHSFNAQHASDTEIANDGLDETCERGGGVEAGHRTSKGDVSKREPTIQEVCFLVSLVTYLVFGDCGLAQRFYFALLIDPVVGNHTRIRLCPGQPLHWSYIYDIILFFFVFGGSFKCAWLTTHSISF
jgi:hypothetical protein